MFLQQFSSISYSINEGVYNFFNPLKIVIIKKLQNNVNGELRLRLYNLVLIRSNNTYKIDTAAYYIYIHVYTG